MIFSVEIRNGKESKDTLKSNEKTKQSEKNVCGPLTSN